jgi:hypothetical protein
MSDTELINISESADTALSSVDFKENGDHNSVRIYVVGFG